MSKSEYINDGIKLATLSAKSGSATSSLIYLYGAASTPVGASYTAPGSTSPTNFQIVSDAHGDVRELRDTSGTAFARYDYDAYGNVTSSQTFATTLISAALAQTISELQPLRYAGYLFDSETGLYYCSQRYYDPATASFISRDPAKADGEKSLYAYCGGEPVGGVDPSGEWNGYVHYDLTKSWALKIGYSSYYANVIATYDRDVDRVHRWIWYQVWNQAYHTNMKFGYQNIATGTKTGNLKTFGTGLHTMQDYWTHRYAIYYVGRIALINKSQHFDLWNASNTPKAAKILTETETKRVLYAYFQKWRKKMSSRPIH